MTKIFNLHLISDSTGETVCSVARAVIARFENIEAIEYIWPLIKTSSQLENVIAAIKENPGVVMYTIVDSELRHILKEVCDGLNVPCIPVLSRAIADFSAYLNMQANPFPASKYELDDNYFSKVEAINYAIAHDDGQSTWDIDESDIIIVGASRTSKSPTCMYLAYRGYRVANIPFVLDCPLPDNLFTVKKPLIVGLTISTVRLLEIRKNRLLSLNETRDTNYVDIDIVKQEISEAKKLFLKNNWPVIDVTRKSVEEVAASIIQIHQAKIKNTIKI
ncbi:MAG: pyruvate, water dikinase regulatory protein [Alphaproteobacteria bacterium]